jgi:transposase
MKMPRVKLPAIVDIDMKEIERVLEQAQTLMPPESFRVIKALVDTLVRLTALVRERGATIARLRRFIGLSGSEKTGNVLPPEPPSVDCVPPEPATAQADDEGENEEPSAGDTPPVDPQPQPSVTPPPKPPIKKAKGHGRIPASAYLAAQHIEVAHETMHPGDCCPECTRGNLYSLKDPACIVRIVGRAPLAATVWECECLRCATCGHVFTARAPKEAQGEKYDETAASMIAIVRYGAGMPFNRLDHVQSDMQTPVPSSTQWDVINERVELVRPAYDELVRLAAQAPVLHNDDSYVRILQFMGKRRAALLAKGKLPDPERTGLFTTAIIAFVATIGTIALFFTGRKHGGENLAELLRQRAAELAPPIQMSDALSRNLPKGHKTIEANCIAHGRRHVVDEIENYPKECRYVLERLALVFKLDDECKEQKLSDEERLLAHQKTSAPIMKELHDWMTAELDEKRIEPNSGLGKAFNYFLKRWEKFTLFLRVPGAPIDNNITERALKMAIKNRNASLFYRSEHGAIVGDIFMTLIHTAELHHQNPFDYLTELQRNYKAVAARPGDWMPWNYRQTLARARDDPSADASVAA